MIEAVVFDLDGVLIDSERVWERARKDVVATFGRTYTETATRDVMGMSAPEWSRYLHDRLGVPLEPERINEEVVARVAASYRNELPLMPTAEIAVKAIARDYPLAIASSSNRSLIELVLELSELRECFRVVVSSEEVGRGKPAPDVYLRAAELLGVPPQKCVAIEDSTNGILSASAAGMLVVAVPTDEHPPAERALLKARFVFADLGEAMALLDRFAKPEKYPERLADEDVVATRELRAKLPDGREFDVVARIGKPKRDGEHWYANYEVLGPDGPLRLGKPDAEGDAWSPRSYHARGADSLQAIEQSMQGLRYGMDLSPPEFAAFGSSVPYHFIHRIIAGWSDRMERHLERLVDDEIERLATMQRDPDPAVRAAAREIIGPRPEKSLDESREP